MTRFNLFVYGRLSGHALLDGCEHVADAVVGGVLYDTGGSTALLMYGSTPVPGRVYSCPAALLLQLDDAQGVGEGRFRRTGAEVEASDGSLVPCWVYTAGPALSRSLLQDRRITV